MIDIEQAVEFFKKRDNPDSLSYSIISDSGNLGPHIVIVGATHGNEVVGVDAIMKYVSHIEANNISLKKGKISWILGNPEAFKLGKRFLEINMNRAYDQLLTDNPEHRRVAQIRKYFQSCTQEGSIDLLIDLHSVSIGDFKIAICLDEKEDAYRMLASLTQLESRFTLGADQLPGSLLQEAESFGSDAVAYECGNHNSTESIHTALWHINKALIEYDLLNQEDLLHVEDLNEPQSIIHFKAITPIKPGIGFKWLVPPDRLHTGGKIHKGEKYAEKVGFEYIATQDCTLFVPDPNPHPDDFDAGFLTTMEVSLPEMYYNTSPELKEHNIKQ